MRFWTLCVPFSEAMPNLEQVLSHLPSTKRTVLNGLVDQLRQVPNMVAIVLGGSYASHTHHATSDLDVGLYYWETAPFDIEAIRAIATAVSEEVNPTVTGFTRGVHGSMAVVQLAGSLYQPKFNV